LRNRRRRERREAASSPPPLFQLSRRIKNQTNPETTLFFLSTKQPNSCQHTPELFFYFRPIPHCHKIKRFNIHSNNTIRPNKTFTEIHQIKMFHFATYLKSNQNSKKPPKPKIFGQSTETGTLFQQKRKKMMKSIFFRVGRCQTNERIGETE
jgi:hypothetical protein